ncbi:hypothetical protein [Brevibacillus brevis]|uniref:hypothetical protein n=1 Tax=Brevibacillus brevis TaxID=1393 RepID=UPI000D0F150D|nr:hypothetical protein [Brevibacillus brevis]PSJ66271.1 hypothetical protein C7J99_26400 [Brevibacillus brevis]RED21776.1 hypothetical protein DES34_11841 [Brevibacillus brevis]GEC92459.1 hypothetical protein BBR01nite_47900 [Brevibacillus brevis]VEF92639.1 Uncharacterised protein [Brevibacillus brevis]
MSFLETFQHRVGMTAFVLVSIFVGAFTQFYYQVVKVPTLTSFVNTIIENKNNDELLLTWGLNLFSGALLALAGFLWAKEAITGDFYYDSSEVAARITCGAVAILCFVYATVFVGYVFTALLGIVIACVIVWILINSKK